MIASLQSSHAALLPGASEPPALRELRARSLRAFEQVGLPDKKLETWRYSSTGKLVRTPFIHDTGPLFEALAAEVAHTETLEGAAAEIVTVNGEIALGLSRLADLPAGLQVIPLRDALSADPALADRLDPARWPARPDSSRGPVPAGQVAPDRGFDLLASAFVQGGAVVRVERDAVVDRPIHILHLTVGEGAPIGCHPRVLVTLERGASATLVERHVGIGSEPALINAVTDLWIGPGAELVHHLWRLGGDRVNHVGLVRAELARNAILRAHQALLGGDWVRSDLDVRFAEPGGECLVTSAQVVDGKRHVDHHAWLRHDAPHCTSRHLARAIAAGQGRAVFDGCIAIAPDAQRSQAELASRNLLLSERAAVFAKPQLEISADDVSAAHGCTIGQLDPEQIAYLRSRGIDETQARRLITRGFVVDLLGEIADPSLREAAQALVLHAVAAATSEPA